jgi:hypothetical protein
MLLRKVAAELLDSPEGKRDGNRINFESLRSGRFRADELVSVRSLSGDIDKTLSVDMTSFRLS